jgi:hypothetical protein
MSPVNDTLMKCNKPFLIRATAEEHSRWLQQAEKKGLQLTPYIRLLLSMDECLKKEYSHTDSHLPDSEKARKEKQPDLEKAKKALEKEWLKINERVVYLKGLLSFADVDTQNSLDRWENLAPEERKQAIQLVDEKDFSLPQALKVFGEELRKRAELLTL